MGKKWTGKETNEEILRREELTVPDFFKIRASTNAEKYVLR